MKTKVCRDCQKQKPVSEYYQRKDTRDGLYSRCKPCHSKFSNRNKPEYRKKNKEKLRAYNAEYWAANKLKYREDCRIRARIWYEENRGRAISSVRMREANQKLSTPDWLTKSQIAEIESFYWLARDLYSVTGEKYHVDHIIPLQGENISGLHVPWNLQVLPADVNLAKGNRYDPDDIYSPTAKGIT